jgi:CTP:molybdopterin cytidylyltransferase MocA
VGLLIGAVVLAAGAATRYGSPKQRLFLPRVLEALHASPVDEIVVVAGAYELEADVRVVSCPEWERGPGASLRCGLAALSPGVEAALVVLADGPDLDPRAVERVLAHRGEAEIVGATYGGSRDHPLVVARRAWAGVPDEGLRALPVHLVDCSDLRPPGDVDFPETSREDQAGAE